MLTVSPSSSSGDVGRGRLGTSSIRAQPARPQLLDRREGGEARLLHFKDGDTGMMAVGFVHAGNEEEQVGGVPFWVDSTLIKGFPGGSDSK